MKNSAKTELKKLKEELKFYFSQNENFKASTGHVPAQFVKYIGCIKCDLERVKKIYGT